MARRGRRAVWLLGLVVGLAACGADGGESGTVQTGMSAPGEREPTTDTSGRLMVVVTTTILGDLVANVAGEGAMVEVLLPEGADPHEYQVSAGQLALLHDQADLVVANGLRLEEGLADVLATARADGVNLIELADFLDPILFSFVSEHGQEEESDDQGDEQEEVRGLDPHFWTDPLRVARAAVLVAEALAAIDPSVDWAAGAESYGAQLAELDEEIQSILASIPQENRKLITNHDSLGYFADRYDFEIIGVVIPGGATLANPSSAQLAELVGEIVEEGVTVIFGETIEPTALAEAVAAESTTDVDVVELHTGSLGEPGTGMETIIVMLRENARRIADSLS